MHQIVLLTALTATSGLFGGGRSCNSGRCGAMAPTYRSAAPGAWTYAPRVPAYTAAPAVAPAAPVAQTPPTAYYRSYYYPYPTAATCPNGTCARR